MDPNGDPIPRRRRGAELESALLCAAWDELTYSGYPALTFDAVAHRAGTSRTVLYRRWETKADLARAAVLHVLRTSPPVLPDTGTLRGDMKGLLRLSNERNMASNALLFSYLGGYFKETGTSPRDLRDQLVGGGAPAVDVIIDRAIARGEVDAAVLTPRTRTVAFDLFRHEALMTLAPVPDAVIDEILDEVFLPLVMRAKPASDADPMR